MRGKIRLGSERGIVLIVALMLLLVLTIIGINSISTTSFESIISGNERLANMAFYSAEAGIQSGPEPASGYNAHFEQGDWTGHPLFGHARLCRRGAFIRGRLAMDV